MSQISYIEDIAKQVAKEEGLTYEEALEICKLSVEYIYEMVKDPNIISISLPNLGTLYFSWSRAHDRYMITDTYRNHRDTLAKQCAMVEELHDQNHNVAHYRRTILTNLRKWFFKNRKRRRESTKAELYQRIEETQNEIT